MFFFTLGTIRFPFDRSVSWLKTLLENKVINDEVLLQSGATSVRKIQHPLLTSIVSLTPHEMRESVSRADLVVTHAGEGTTLMLADMGARFVLLPRCKRYGEHCDDHQLLMAKEFSKYYGIPYCTDIQQLAHFIDHPPPPFKGKIFDGPSLADYFVHRYGTVEAPFDSVQMTVGRSSAS
ncbi:MAG: glycosyltransferase [Cyanobacteria bacterium P01_A01_bin.17]